MARIVLEGVGKTYPGGVEAVQAVDLEIADGEFLVLVGPSGCGKSTTLRMIAGLEDVTRGRITLDGRDITHLPAKDRNLAMVFQSYALYPHMTVLQNLGFGLVPRMEHRSGLRALVDGGYRARRGEELAALRARVEETAELLELGPLLERKPRALSGGQRQRVALGRAIVREPAAFLFDEPLSNLDARLRLEMRAEIKALQRRLGVTGIWVTHDQEEAMTLGDRMVVLDGGAVQQVGTADEVYARPANRFVAGFVGTPPMNFLAGTARRAEGTLVFEVGAARVALPACDAVDDGQAIVLGVRPDAWLLDADQGFEAELVLSEHLGDRRDLVFQSAQHGRLIARVDARVEPRPGERLRLGIDPGRIGLFEAGANGRRVL